MTKNYFTDEQVKEAINKITPFKGHLGKRLLTEFELKNLMNLAVEVAIGNIVGYTSSFRIESILNGKDSIGLYRDKKDSNYEIPLYSVKELENDNE